MYDGGVCWGYGNYDVEADEVCDSYSREQIPDESQARYNMPISRQLVERAGFDWQDQIVEVKFNEPRGDEIDMSFRYPRIQVLRGDDWVAVYRNGKRVFNGHSVPLDMGLEALGIRAESRWVEPGGWDEETGEHFYVGDEFPEEL